MWSDFMCVCVCVCHSRWKCHQLTDGRLSSTKTLECVCMYECWNAVKFMCAHTVCIMWQPICSFAVLQLNCSLRLCAVHLGSYWWIHLLLGLCHVLRWLIEQSFQRLFDPEVNSSHCSFILQEYSEDRKSWWWNLGTSAQNLYTHYPVVWTLLQLKSSFDVPRCY